MWFDRTASNAAPHSRCEGRVLLQGKGRSVDTAQHHVAMPGCFTLFYRNPKVCSGFEISQPCACSAISHAY